jgi:hypothetical protein
MPDMSETQQDPRDLQLTVLGLGEAGAIFAAGIAARSGGVRGFDPADVGDPPGVDRCATAAEAVTGAGIVIALTHAGQAMTAAQSAVGHLRPGSYYADFATGDPGLKRDIAALAHSRGVRFIDGAIMNPVRPGSPPPWTSAATTRTSLWPCSRRCGQWAASQGWPRPASCCAACW